ncbi:hypothetical protein [Planktothrix mougeotii]|uniref:CRISPR-associated protein n=1 Tax=Planktothrix mougeotii LEGE 06226 TaxID=1828728 RepID=A0ABR9U7A5_9CYAN|nr:hypothetical protein [Planktothrix mougeotii]MBE9142335.1 hypothetical protein [Planktothrix mougeotii LEGE 06226]
MSQQSILVATIGTRDLSFQITSGKWYNVGDDRIQNGAIIGEQAEVLSDLGFAEKSYRDLTQYLLENIDQYRERVKPIIFGKVFLEQGRTISKVYLIATNQQEGIREREKDTIYSAQIIKAWLMDNFKHLNNEKITIIPLGEDGTNPSNFEEMFRWWSRVWRNQIRVKKQLVWVCLKGGVGQASEAARVSGLSLYGDRIQFYEFKANAVNNYQGIPSDYTGPFLGTNYLWDRIQQQCLKLLERFDYDEVSDLLEPYFEQDPENFGSLRNLVQAGIQWNQGNFQDFFRRSESILNPPQQDQGHSWWWMGYEQAMLGVVRFKQQNTVEAMLHSYRAIEGTIYLWAIQTFPTFVQNREGEYLKISSSITERYPQILKGKYFQSSDSEELKGWFLEDFIKAVLPSTSNSQDFITFWSSAKKMRNQLSHRLGGLTEDELFKGWKVDLQMDCEKSWKNRILNCLNTLTSQSFTSLEGASLFIRVHHYLINKIKQYEP